MKREINSMHDGTKWAQYGALNLASNSEELNEVCDD